MSDAIKRAIRSFFQTFLGVVLSSGILSGFSTAGVVDWSALEKVAVSGLSAGVVAVLVFAHNSLEDKGTVPTLLK